MLDEEWDIKVAEAVQYAAKVVALCIGQDQRTNKDGSIGCTACTSVFTNGLRAYHLVYAKLVYGSSPS